MLSRPSRVVVHRVIRILSDENLFKTGFVTLPRNVIVSEEVEPVTGTSMTGESMICKVPETVEPD